MYFQVLLNFIVPTYKSSLWTFLLYFYGLQNKLEKILNCAWFFWNDCDFFLNAHDLFSCAILEKSCAFKILSCFFKINQKLLKYPQCLMLTEFKNEAYLELMENIRIIRVKSEKSKNFEMIIYWFLKK